MKKAFLFLSIILSLRSEPLPQVNSRLNGEIVLRLYQTMYDVHTILDRAGITYWINFGTLLGAVRHNGLIPWDDDLDINIFKLDNEKLLSLKPLIECLGYQLTTVKMKGAFSHYKLSQKIAGATSYTYPWLDIFLMEQRGNKIYYTPTFGGLREGEERFIRVEELFPLKKYRFGDFQVFGPANPLNLVKFYYGEDCMDYAYATFAHGSNGGISIFGKTLLSQSDKKCAIPTAPLKDNSTSINSFMLTHLKK